VLVWGDFLPHETQAFIYLFIYFKFIYFLSTELSGSSVTGAWLGAWRGGLVAWLRIGQASRVF